MSKSPVGTYSENMDELSRKRVYIKWWIGIPVGIVLFFLGTSLPDSVVADLFTVGGAVLAIIGLKNAGLNINLFQRQKQK